MVTRSAEVATPPRLDTTLSADALATDGAVRDAALLRLRAFLVTVGAFELERRREQLRGLSSDAAAALAAAAADAACAALLSHLDDYRGQSRFAVWAAKFAIHAAAARARTREYEGRTGAAGDTNSQGEADGKRTI